MNKESFFTRKNSVILRFCEKCSVSVAEGSMNSESWGKLLDFCKWLLTGEKKKLVTAESPMAFCGNWRVVFLNVLENVADFVWHNVPLVSLEAWPDLLFNKEVVNRKLLSSNDTLKPLFKTPRTPIALSFRWKMTDHSTFLANISLLTSHEQ